MSFFHRILLFFKNNMSRNVYVWCYVLHYSTMMSQLKVFASVLANKNAGYKTVRMKHLVNVPEVCKFCFVCCSWCTHCSQCFCILGIFKSYFCSFHPYPKWPNSNVHLKQHGQNFPYTVLLEHLEVTDKKFLFEKDSFSCTNLKPK